MDPSNVDLVMERLARLEQENRRLNQQIDRLSRVQRRWRWWAGGLIVVGAFLSTGVATARLGERIITGERLILRDPLRGVRRVEMGAQFDLAYLVVCGPDGEPRFEIRVPDQDRVVILRDKVPLP